MSVEIDLKKYAKTYGEHTLKVYVTGDGFRKSEDVSYTFESLPYIKADKDHVHLSNVQEGVSQIDFYVEDALWKSIEHDTTSTEEMDIDYSDTPIDASKSYKIYIIAQTSYGEFKSNETYNSYAEITPETLDTTYTFKLDTDGYYKPTNTYKDGTFALIRLNILNIGTKKNLNIYWRQSSESNYDFGLIGNKSEALSKNNNIDTNVLLSAKGKTYTADQKFTIEIDVGECFYDIKYRKDGSQSSGWDRFDFRYEIEEKGD